MFSRLFYVHMYPDYLDLNFSLLYDLGKVICLFCASVSSSVK